MANSRTLLVYVLALVVCGGSSRSFWVSANTVPVLKEPVAPTGVSPQHQKHQQQYRPEEQQPLRTAQHQQIQETSRTPSSSSATPVAQTQHQSYNSNNRNNAPPVYNHVRNAWGLSAGSSDAGPYTSGYGYITGRTFNPFQPAPAPVPKSESAPSNYPVAEVGRESRQTYQGLESLSTYLQNGLNSPLDFKSLLLGCFFTYGVRNFGIPESMSTLIPIYQFFKSRFSGAADTEPNKKEAVTISNEIPTLKESEKTNSVSTKGIKESEKESAFPAVNKDVAEPGKDASHKKEAKEPVMNAPNKVEAPEQATDAPNKNEVATKSRRKRNILPPQAQADMDLTELAAMVVSAIQSGECMQRSICLLGSQIGNSNKGRLAFTLVDKLVPDSVQGNQYFLTLKKALKGGESFCDRFRCRLN